MVTWILVAVIVLVVVAVATRLLGQRLAARRKASVQLGAVQVPPPGGAPSEAVLRFELTNPGRTPVQVRRVVLRTTSVIDVPVRQHDGPTPPAPAVGHRALLAGKAGILPVLDTATGAVAEFSLEPGETLPVECAVRSTVPATYLVALVASYRPSGGGPEAQAVSSGHNLTIIDVTNS